MKARETKPAKPPVYMLALQCLAYVVVAQIFVRWAASGPVADVASIAAAAGCVVHQLAVQSRLRWPIVVAASMVVLGAALWIPDWLANSTQITQDLGIAGSIQLVASLKYGLIMFAAVLGLRGIAVRWPAFAALEAALLVAMVVIPLSGHRDFHFSQPQVLSDWAFAHGYEPGVILYGVGIATVLFVALLRFQSVNPWHSVVILVLLTGTAGVGAYTTLVHGTAVIGNSGMASTEPPAKPQAAAAGSKTGSSTASTGGKPHSAATTGSGAQVGGNGTSTSTGGTGYHMSRQEAIAEAERQQAQGKTNNSTTQNSSSGQSNSGQSNPGQSNNSNPAVNPGQGIDPQRPTNTTPPNTTNGGGQQPKPETKPETKPSQPEQKPGPTPQPKPEQPKPEQPKPEQRKPQPSKPDAPKPESKPNSASNTAEKKRPENGAAKPQGEKGPEDKPKDKPQEKPLPPPTEMLEFDPGHWKTTPTPMAVVTLHNACPPLSGRYYFRGETYSRLEGPRLFVDPDPAVDPDFVREFPTEASPPSNDPPGTVLATLSTMLPLPHPVGLFNTRTFEPRQNADPSQFKRTYAFTTDPLPPFQPAMLNLGAGNPNWSPELRQHYLALPDDPRYLQLATQILGAAAKEQPEAFAHPSAMLYAATIRRWVETHMIYTLKPTPTTDADVTAAYLFGDRRGFCSYIASATTYLLRAASVPARVSCGFLVPAERRGLGSTMLLMESDQHAWCEIYMNGVGWFPIDPAVERSEEPSKPEPDKATQNLLGEKNRQAELGKDHPPQAPLSPWMKLLIVPAWILACLYAVKLWRWLAPLWGSDRQLYRLCYRATLDRCTELGMSRETGETREEFAQRVARVAPEFAALSEAHVYQWLARRPVLDRKQWLSLQAASVSRITGSVPLHRRLLGWFNPVSWIWSR